MQNQRKMEPQMILGLSQQERERNIISYSLEKKAAQEETIAGDSPVNIGRREECSFLSNVAVRRM
jgi:hypothetical protein